MKRKLIIICSIVLVAIVAGSPHYKSRAVESAPVDGTTEVVPTDEEQKPILDTIAERDRVVGQYNSQIIGMIRMLAAQHKKDGVDLANGWDAVQEPSGKAKFVKRPAPKP